MRRSRGVRAAAEGAPRTRNTAAAPADALALDGMPPAEEGAPLVVRLMPPDAGAPGSAAAPLAAALPGGGGMPELSDHAAMPDISMPAVEQRLGEAREEGMSIMGALSPPDGPSV